MKKFIIVFGMAMVLLAGCNTSETEHDGMDHHPSDEILPVEVAVETNPEQITIQEEVEIVAVVTHGEEMVEDADEVLFEIWREGQEEDEHEKIEAEHSGEGRYSIQKTFEEPGTYSIIPHTTARDMHTMPKVTIEVKE